MAERRDKRTKSYGAILTITLVMLALFVRQRHTDIVPAEDIVEKENFVDTYTMNVRSTQFDEQGQIARIVKADSAAHYALSDESVLDAPNIQSTSARGKTWQTSARKGKVRPNGSTYDLWNTVLIEQIDGDALARTESLTFFSATGIAKTKKEVIIDSKVGQTIGVGMRADLNKEVIKLESEVRSVFEPPQ